MLAPCMFVFFVFRQGDGRGPPQTQANVMVVSAADLEHLQDKEKRVHINCAKRLKRVSLEWLPAESQPSGEAVDDLATKVAKKVAKGIENPFIFEVFALLRTWCLLIRICIVVQNLKNWTPSWCKEIDGDDRNMSMLTWAISFEAMALGADMANQWEYWSSRAHMTNCQKVAGTS